MNTYKTFLLIWLSIVLLSCGNNKKEQEIILEPQFTFSSYGNPFNKDAWVNDIVDSMNTAAVKNTPVGDSVEVLTIQKNSLNKRVDPFTNPDLPFNLYLDSKRLEESMALSLNKRECLDSIQNIDFSRYAVFLVSALNESTTCGLKMSQTEDGKVHLKLRYTYIPAVETPSISSMPSRTVSVYKIEKGNADSLIVYYEVGTTQMDTIRYPLNK